MAKKRTDGFIAIDGESVTLDRGKPTEEHLYVILAASTSEHLINEEGLSTAQCMDFLIQLKRDNPKKRIVAFGLNYDVNMMLRDLSPKELLKLWQKGSVLVTLSNGVSYKMEWIPGKTFAVCRFHEKRWVRVSDVFGFFQTSFVRALEAWKVEDAGGNIARMKLQRSDFKIRDIPNMLRYCISECELLVELMKQLENSFNVANLRPAAWIGAGSVAARMLRKEGVNYHRVPDDSFPPAVHDAILRAYYGGRVEVFLQGVLQNVVNYDLRSAYPSEALNQPTLRGEWRQADSYVSNARFALWKIRWNVDPENSVMPFPLRTNKQIFYPTNGSGWYHAKEVRVAKRVYGEAIEILDGWIFTPLTSTQPFAFIREAYETRAEAKRQGLASEKALKLGLNAIYGKLAQGVGYRGKTPAFRSFYWAGSITAGTRARLLDMASANLRGVVSMSTDGIVFSGDPDFVESDTLGGLEKSYYQEFFIAQPGIYRAILPDGNEIQRSRGFFIKEIDYDDLQRGWLTVGPTYAQVSESTRFCGLGSALMRADMDSWRRWVTSERCLNLHSSRKFYVPGVERGKVMRLMPPTFQEDKFSERYVPKTRGLEMFDEIVDFMQGTEQPMREF